MSSKHSKTLAKSCPKPCFECRRRIRDSPNILARGSRCVCYASLRRTHDSSNLLATSCLEQRLHMCRPAASSEYSSRSLWVAVLCERVPYSRYVESCKKLLGSAFWVCAPHAQPSQDSSKKLPQAMLFVQSSHEPHCENPIGRYACTVHVASSEYSIHETSNPATRRG